MNDWKPEVGDWVIENEGDGTIYKIMEIKESIFAKSLDGNINLFAHLNDLCPAILNDWITELPNLGNCLFVEPLMGTEYYSVFLEDRQGTLYWYTKLLVGDVFHIWIFNQLNKLYNFKIMPQLELLRLMPDAFVEKNFPIWEDK